ncbi:MULTISPECIES: hypothetical protein [Bacillus cereus group]|nr:MULTISPECIES: hypothetical protein [Bacillus cereus group]
MPSQIPVNTDNKKTGRKTGDQFDHKGHTLRQVENVWINTKQINY